MTRVAGLMGVIDEDEEFYYIDDGIPAETSKKESSTLKTIEAKADSAMGKGENSGMEPHDPIDLDSSEAETLAADQSRSPPPMLEDAKRSTMEITGGGASPLIKDTNILQLEKAGVVS
jgi:hypothetical protein